MGKSKFDVSKMKCTDNLHEGKLDSKHIGKVLARLFGQQYLEMMQQRREAEEATKAEQKGNEKP